MPGEKQRHLVGAVCIAVKQVGPAQQEGTVEQRLAAFINRLEPLDQVSELLEMELVGLQIHRFGRRSLAVVRQVQVQRALHAFQELEVHLRKIVVQHQGRDPRLIHLKREHDESSISFM